MKSYLKNILAISLFSILAFSGCDSGTSSEDLVIINGVVYTYDADKNAIPVENALVSATNIYKQTLTNQYGEFSFEFEPETDTAYVSLSITKTGYLRARSSVSVKKGLTFQVPEIELLKDEEDTSGDGTVSGDAAHIEVVTPNEDHIYVYSSGLQETAGFWFKITDSEGIPVDNDHAETVHFNILHGPDGGEYLYPQEAVTVDGYVYTTLNSGTISGPVQIEAYIETDSKIIRSTPSRVAIYGGLPDDNHFSVAIEKVNIAGQVHFGILDNVTAFVGDKYSNPVAPGTVVYFSTDYGIVQGAAVTDEMGRATVSYMSAAPLPPNPAASSFAKVTAWTYGDTLTNLTLSSDVSLLLSSVTDAIQVTPSSFEYDNSNRAQTFDFIVSDIYGNPVVSNTAISVKATAGELYGDTDIKMLDTRYPGPGSTDFSFAWAPGDSLEAPQVYISITVTTPAEGNGYRSTTVGGVKVADENP
ncbi:MAG: Ig-like domain-containing protein [Calditrichae bacterium]|nr:Ig-like domain-containing protein [Calditrichota bacterium]MCB9057299.1 Ig-like domain-containing protein [Calditrichia bacterium]